MKSHILIELTKTDITPGRKVQTALEYALQEQEVRTFRTSIQVVVNSDLSPEQITDAIVKTLEP
jgi:hypothetical protein